MRRALPIFIVAFLSLIFTLGLEASSPSEIVSFLVPDQTLGIFVLHDSIYYSTQNPEAELPEHFGNLLFLEVFDRFGRLVYKKRLKGLKTGEHESINWSGIDNFGRPVAQGVYFFRITGRGGFNASQIDFVRYLWFSDVTSTHLPPDSSEAADIEFGDVDNDGDLDIISGINATTHFAQPILLINHGSGIYKDETNLRLPELQTVTNDVDLADVDNDGDLDIYLANTGFSSLDCRDLLLINDGRGFFQDESKKRLPPEIYITQNVEFDDIDGDGDLDLALAILGGWKSLFEVRIFVNDGKGFFVDETKARIPPFLDYTIFNLTSEDVDKDEDEDLLISSLGKMIIDDYQGVPVDTTSGQNALLINDGQGYFTDQTEDRMPDYDDDLTTKIRVKDVNGDDLVDLYVVNIGFSWEQASNRLYLNEGDGFFVKDIHKHLPHEALLWNNDAELADFDNDGDMDIFMINVRPGEDALDNLLINEGGSFSNQSWRLPDVLDFSTSCAVGDMDGDFDFDLVIANASGVVGIGGQDRLYENVLLIREVQDLPEAHLINGHPVAQNYPNPFNLETEIVLTIPKGHPFSDPMVIKIYNVTGQLVRTLVNDDTREGKNYVLWDGRDGQNQPVSSGIYFYRLEAGEFSLCGHMTMIK
jgi:hypothetical protein